MPRLSLPDSAAVGPSAVPAPPRPQVALPVLWAGLLLYLTLAPAEGLPPTPKWELLSFDTAAHAAFFGVQAALSWYSLRHQLRWPRLARHAYAVVLLGCTAFGALIEALQMALPFNRHGEWSDLISDTLGTAAALALLRLAASPLRRRGWVLSLLFGFSLSVGTARGQDLPRARATIRKLASPRLHGRGYVKQGERKAAAYLRGRLRRLGLEPLAPEYTQPFTLDVNTFPGKLRLGGARRQDSIEQPKFWGQPSWELVPGKDFIAAAASPAYQSTGGGSNLLPLDTLIFTDTLAARRYLNLSDRITKKCLRCPPNFLSMSARDEARLPQLPAATQLRIDRYGRLVFVPKLMASLSSEQTVAPRIQVLAWKWPRSETGQSIGLHVDAQLRRNYPTQNLAAVIRGTAQPDSFLVVTAHYDHLGRMGRRAYFPGANDNASGVALLLELAHHYARPENRPACSIAFLLFGAEEAGLVGSRYFVQHPLLPLQQIKFLVNLDLLGTGEEGATVVNGRVHEAAFLQLQQLNEAGRYLPGLAARGRAANSDHFPFSEAGVPAFFLYTRGGSPAYHDVHDTPDKLSLAGFPGAFQLVRDFLNARSGPQP